MVLYRGHTKEQWSFSIVHDLLETFFPCKSTDNTNPDTTEVETEEQRPVSVIHDKNKCHVKRSFA
ncbi:protein E6 [Trichinella spiralis]|uniref:protein E6 n=1 Tax=Trichinella spiralis TaxID=6334 RepID=UPI0001EFDB8E|nr:protein E6 [Trichinella spiralis]